MCFNFVVSHSVDSYIKIIGVDITVKNFNSDEMELKLALIMLKAMQNRTGKLNEKTTRNIERMYNVKFHKKGDNNGKFSTK